MTDSCCIGCAVVDLKTVEPGHLPDAIAAIVGTPEVDAAVDCVGFEARGCGHKTCNEVPAQVLNDCMQVTTAGGGIGIPGLYVTEDPGAVRMAASYIKCCSMDPNSGLSCILLSI